MPEYAYEALTASGERVTGRCWSESLQSARDELAARGLDVQQIDAVPQGTRPAPASSPEQETAEEPIFSIPWWRQERARPVAASLAELSSAGMPLASGLRALGNETPLGRTREGLFRLSARLEAGEPLDEALRHAEVVLPPHVGTLVRAGLESGNLPLVLEQYMVHARAGLELRRQTWLSLMYPLVLLAATIGVMLFYILALVPQFAQIFADFNTSLPGPTVLLINLSEFLWSYGLYLLIGLAAVTVGVVVGVWQAGGWALVSRLIVLIPVIGPMFRLSSLSQYCHILSILVDNYVRLPEALRMAGGGVRDAGLRDISQMMAEDVEQGRDLTQLCYEVPRFPAELRPLFRWATRRTGFAEALRAAGDIFAAQARVQAGLIGIILKPVILVNAVVLLVAAVISLFMPLITLINDLS